MTCRRTRPDGNPCQCADEFTTDGLCAVCAAQASVALVPVFTTDLMADPEVEELYATLPPKPRAFLEVFAKTRTIKEAAEIVGMHRTTHNYWLKTVEGYPEAYAIARQVVADYWNWFLDQTVEKGLREQVFDADGNLKHTRFREDASLLKMRVMAADPDTYSPDRGKGNNVVIVLNHTNEGWSDED